MTGTCKPNEPFPPQAASVLMAFYHSNRYQIRTKAERWEKTGYGKAGLRRPMPGSRGKELGSYAKYLHVWPSISHLPKAWASFEFTAQRPCLPGFLSHTCSKPTGATWMPSLALCWKLKTSAGQQGLRRQRGQRGLQPLQTQWPGSNHLQRHLTHSCALQRRQEALILVWKMLTAKPLFKI